MHNKRIIVVGGDGFCGWPTALHLSNKGHEVTIIDSLARRKIDDQLNVQSLTPIQDPTTRILAWRQLTGRDIKFENLCVAKDFNRLHQVFKDIRPDAIIHFGEQRAAPYSMKSTALKCYTVNNNIIGTHNILAAIADLKFNCHIVHLGTMGVYGYGTINSEIPEGYLKVLIEDNNSNNVEHEIVYPPSPGSVYHLTKTMDHQMFQFYQKNNSLRITDLHQGIVWGTQTQETALDERLINRFDYDGDFGTVLNRFLVQATIGHPVTVHGVGGQTRAFINIQDTVKCIELALENPPNSGERVKILNQVAETHTILDLGQQIVALFGGNIEFVDNPRKELAKNQLSVSNSTFLSLGLSPILLSNGLITEINEVIKKYENRIDRSKIYAKVRW